MQGELYNPGQPLKGEDFDYEKYSLQDSLSLRITDLYSPGVLRGSQELSEPFPFQITAGVGLSIGIGTGVAISSGTVDSSDSTQPGGERIHIPASDVVTGQNWRRAVNGGPGTGTGTGPFHESPSGLGGWVPTPQSTLTRLIPLADNSLNYVWIGYLHAIDPSVFSLHKITSGKIYPHGLDGYDIQVTTSATVPTFNGNANYFLVGIVTTASGAITSINQDIMVFIARTKSERIGITIDTASPPDSYANGQTKFLDDHINAQGTGPGINPANPHNTGIADLGLQFVNVDLVGHRKFHHSHGIIGTPATLTSSLFPQTDNTTPIVGDIGMVFLKQLIAGEQLILEGEYFTQVQPILTGPSGLGATGDAYVSFETGLASGVYSIFVSIVENSQIVLSGPLVTGNTIAVTVDGTPVSQAFTTDSNTTLTLLAATIAGLPNVASAVVSGNNIVVTPTDITHPIVLTALSVTGGLSQPSASIVVTTLTPIINKRLGLVINSNEYVICTVTWTGTAFVGGTGFAGITSDERLFGLTGTKDLQKGCVTSEKLAVGSIVEDNIAPGAVDSAAIHAADAFGVHQADITQGYGVKTGHIQDQNITASKMAPLSVSTASLQLNAVTGANIAPSTIEATNIDVHAIESPQLALADNVTGQDTTTGSGVKTTHIADGAVTAAKLDISLSSAFVEPGTVIMWAGAEASMPVGYLPCDGRILNASINTQYLNLFNAIGNTWGGSGFSFNVPDLRGLFVRMVNTTTNGTASAPFNDPNEANRTKHDGVSPATGVGSYQTYDVQIHNHSYTTSGFSGTATVDDDLSNSYGQFAFTGTTGPFPASPAGQETRPKNAYMLYIIKY